MKTIAIIIRCLFLGWLAFVIACLLFLTDKIFGPPDPRPIGWNADRMLYPGPNGTVYEKTVQGNYVRVGK